MKIKKYMLLAAPYIMSVIAGILVYLVGLSLNDNLKDLFINISAAFLGIPLIFLFYQVIQNISKKKLNKEIFDYVKMRVDKEILSITNHINKMIFPLEEIKFSTKNITELLSIKKEKLKDNLSNNKYLGFQLYKSWEITNRKLCEVLADPYIISKINDDQQITTIELIKALRTIEDIQKIDNLYFFTDEKATSYKIDVGVDTNKPYIQYPGNTILLRDLGDNKFLVSDFGYFYPCHLEKLLYYYTINAKYLIEYTESIFQVLSKVSDWVELTGKEFIIDNHEFRMFYS